MKKKKWLPAVLLLLVVGMLLSAIAVAAMDADEGEPAPEAVPLADAPAEVAPEPEPEPEPEPDPEPTYKLVTFATYWEDRISQGIDRVEVAWDDPMCCALMSDMRTALAMYDGQDVRYRVQICFDDIRGLQPPKPNGDPLCIDAVIDTFPSNRREKLLYELKERGVEVDRCLWSDWKEKANMYAYADLTKEELMYIIDYGVTHGQILFTPEREIIRIGKINVTLVDEFGQNGFALIKTYKQKQCAE